MTYQYESYVYCPHGRYDFRWASNKNLAERKDTRSVSTYLDVERFIESVRKAADGLMDAQVELNQEYGDYILEVVGWVPATPEEVAALKRHLTERKQRSDDHERAEFERLRKKYEKS